MADSLPSCADAFALAEAIAHRCEGAHPYQDSWRARCPNHNGQSDTSLAITPAVMGIRYLRPCSLYLPTIVPQTWYWALSSVIDRAIYAGSVPGFYRDGSSRKT